MKAQTRPDDGEEYYAYILLYVDDVHGIHHDSEDVLGRLSKQFKLKHVSLRNTDIYFSAKLKRTQTENGVWSWL